jgi:hypothetical protein
MMGPEWIPGGFTLLCAIIATISLIVNRRGAERAKRTDLVPPTWPEILAKFERQDRKIDTLVGLLTEAIEQHPKDAQPLVFSPVLLAQLQEDTIPGLPTMLRRQATRTRRPPRSKTA